MKPVKHYHHLSCLAVLLILTACDLFENNSGVPVNESIWVNGFLASWQHNPETEWNNSGLMTVDEIDWEGLTHLTYYSLAIDSLGQPAQSLDPTDRFNFNSDRLESIVPAAHERDVSILFSIGGDGSETGVSVVLRSENRPQLIQTITDIIETYGFDGVHLNLLQLAPEDYSNYRQLILELGEHFNELRTRRNLRPLLTIVAQKSEGELRLFSDLHPYVDQFHIFTFDMVQPWRGWKAWHGSALYNETVYFDENPGRLLPSTDAFVEQTIAAGVPRSKIGIAISFYAQIWESVHLRQKWVQWPVQDMSIFYRIPYSELIEEYSTGDYLWDDEAKVAYLELEEPRRFVSFENPRSAAEKVRYAESKRIGGVMIWELGGGYTGTGQHPLMQAVRESTYQYRNRTP